MRTITSVTTAQMPTHNFIASVILAAYQIRMKAMSIKTDFNTMTISGTTDRQPLTGCTDVDKRLVYYFNLLPNCLLSICPDYLLTHYLRPRGPEQVYIETEWFCSTEQMKDPTFDPSDAIEFWHKTNKQDWALCENAMKGLKSSGHLPGRYQAGETCTHLFDQWYGRWVYSRRCSKM